jgi:hypothetical protein
MFGLGKKERRDREIKEIQTWIVGQSLAVAGALEGPAQLVAILEAMAFFLYAVSRLSYRPDNEKLRGAVLDSSFNQMVSTYSAMLRKRAPEMNRPSLENDVAILFATREQEYGEAKSLLGETPHDKGTAIRLAALRIGEAADLKEPDIRIFAILTALMTSYVAMELPRRIGQVEEYL